MFGRRLRLWVGSIIGLVLLAVIGGLIFIYSGIYNVAATYPDSAPAEWLLGAVMDHSVARHARGIKVPALDDPAKIRAGAGLYATMCAGCHGAPGVEVGKVARGLNPPPPELTEAAGDWKPNEFFWITKNGIRMSGMPAMDMTYSDDEIWAITAFAQKLPAMKPAEYKALTSPTAAPNTK